jgi:AcrR family transcriptional regulator
MNQKIEKGRSTRQRIIETASRLFAVSGYEATSIDAVLTASGFSRGALYHHFASKEALFEAVLETIEEGIAAATVEAARGIADPVAALRAGGNAWLELARDPTVRQIVLIDAPAVMGWEKWRAIDARHGFGLLKAGLKNAARDGRMRENRVEIFAHILLAALIELALLIARAEKPARALRGAQEAYAELTAKLLGERPL